MKLRHAAALAVVSWYLMTPPRSQGSTPPLKWWNVRGTFNTEAECKDGMKSSPVDPENPYAKDSMLLKALREGKLDPGAWPFLAKCVSSDDPQLKEK